MPFRIMAPCQFGSGPSEVLSYCSWLVAYANFSPNDTIVLACQAYIAAFHMGGVIYHRKLGHHPAVGVPVSVFVLIAFLVVTIRVNVMVTLLGTVVCALIAMVLAEILVHPKGQDGQDRLLEESEEDALPEDRARQYSDIGSGA